MQNPLNAESFSSLSLISQRAVHHAWAKEGNWGAIRAGVTRPRRPIVTAAFSANDFCDLGLSKMDPSRFMSSGMKGSIKLESPTLWSAISPVAQAALLQTEMLSGAGSGSICWMIEGMICETTGRRMSKQVMAMSPRSACADCRTAASGCWLSAVFLQISRNPAHIEANRHEV
jgi:hypothetical protein